MEATFVRLSAEGLSSAQLADEAVARWRELDSILSPIIGQRGVAALYKRALYLIRGEYPALIASHADDLPFGDFAPLRDFLTQQTSAEASVINLALYKSFYSILTGLIGVSLTERLLQTTTDNPSSGPAVQDPSP